MSAFDDELAGEAKLRNEAIKRGDLAAAIDHQNNMEKLPRISYTRYELESLLYTDPGAHSVGALEPDQHMVAAFQLPSGRVEFYCATCGSMQ